MTSRTGGESSFGLLGPLELRARRPAAGRWAAPAFPPGFLLLHANEVVRRDALIDGICGEEPAGARPERAQVASMPYGSCSDRPHRDRRRGLQAAGRARRARRARFLEHQEDDPAAALELCAGLPSSGLCAVCVRRGGSARRPSSAASRASHVAELDEGAHDVLLPNWSEDRRAPVPRAAARPAHPRSTAAGARQTRLRHIAKSRKRSARTSASSRVRSCGDGRRDSAPGSGAHGRRGVFAP